MRPGWGLPAALALLMLMVVMLTNALALQHLLSLLSFNPHQFVVLILLLGVLALNALAN